jgi:hypothetical protein
MAPMPPGPIAPQPQGPLAPWPHSPLAPWPHSPMAPWPHGPMASWPHGPMSPWTSYYKRKSENGNLRLLVQTKNGNGKLTFVCCYGNGKRKLLVLGRQTINGNRRLLFRQTCPSMVIGKFSTSLKSRDKTIVIGKLNSSKTTFDVYIWIDFGATAVALTDRTHRSSRSPGAGMNWCEE